VSARRTKAQGSGASGTPAQATLQTPVPKVAPTPAARQAVPLVTIPQVLGRLFELASDKLSDDDMRQLGLLTEDAGCLVRYMGDLCGNLGCLVGSDESAGCYQDTASVSKLLFLLESVSAYASGLLLLAGKAETQRSMRGMDKA
jgi:hypothetical protein